MSGGGRKKKSMETSVLASNGRKGADQSPPSLFPLTSRASKKKSDKSVSKIKSMKVSAEASPLFRLGEKMSMGSVQHLRVGERQLIYTETFCDWKNVCLMGSFGTVGD